jgi:hypothetical protein
MNQLSPDTTGASAPFPMLARAAAQILLKSNIIRYDAVASTPFTLDLAALAERTDIWARLADMMADVLSALDPDDAVAAGGDDIALVHTIAARLHLPKLGRDRACVIPVAWKASALPATGGVALFDDRLGDGGDDTAAPRLTLTSWRDVLEVMHLNGYGDARARFALAAALRPIHEDVAQVG